MSNNFNLETIRREVWPDYDKFIAEIAKAGGMCEAKDDGFICTLPKGHKAEMHIAHSSFGTIIHRWYPK